MNVILSIGLLIFTGYLLGELAEKNKTPENIGIYPGRYSAKS